MSHKGSRIQQPINFYQQNQQTTYVPIDQLGYLNSKFNANSSYRVYNNNNYSAMNHNNKVLSSNEVSQITGEKIREGSVIKGRSRIQYVPFEKKIMDYEVRTYIEKVPRTRKIIEYEERKYIENVPREVIKQEFLAVEKITQYYKEIIPEKKIQIVPVEKKRKKIQYVPVEKYLSYMIYDRQIVHYPKNEDFRNVQGQSRVILESQGVNVKHDAQYRPIESDLLYRFTNNTQNPNVPVGYVDMGQRRYLSTAPTHSTNNLGYSNVQVYGENNEKTLENPFEFQQSQLFEASGSFINNLRNPSELGNKFKAYQNTGYYQENNINNGNTSRSIHER